MKIVRFITAGILVCAFLLGALAPSAEANELLLIPTGGLTVPTGDVKDLLLDGGLVGGVRVAVSLKEWFYLSGGSFVSFFSGKEIGGTEFTTGGFSFSFEGGGIVYLLPRAESTLRPYVAGHLGFGVMRWNYSIEAQNTTPPFPVNDRNAYIYIVPEAGLDLRVSEDIGLVAGGRYLLTSWTDTTREGFTFDLKGDFWEVYGGLAFSL